MNNLKYRGGTPWSKEHDPDGNLERIDASVGISTTLNGYGKIVDFNSELVVDPDENVEGLATVIALANSMKTVINAHIADWGETTEVHIDEDTTEITADDATDLPTALALVADILTKYTLHNEDARLATPAYHLAQVDGHALVTADAPTDLNEALVRLNDAKAKYNSHEDSVVSHRAGNQHSEATGDGVFGVNQLVPLPGLLSTDYPFDLTFVSEGSSAATSIAASTIHDDYFAVEFNNSPIEEGGTDHASLSFLFLRH